MEIFVGIGMGLELEIVWFFGCVELEAVGVLTSFVKPDLFQACVKKFAVDAVDAVVVVCCSNVVVFDFGEFAS